MLLAAFPAAADTIKVLTGGAFKPVVTDMSPTSNADRTQGDGAERHRGRAQPGCAVARRSTS
jgi:hypothetical protein